jgi:hypothetical protein
MNRWRAAALFVVVAGLTIVAAACGDDSGSAATPNPGGPAVGELPSQGQCPPPNIATIDPSILKVDAAPTAPLVHGQPASFKVTLTNTSETDVPLVFASSQQADILLSQDGKPLYEWSADRAFTQEIRCQTLAAGQVYTVELAETKPLPVPPGDYVLTARTVTAPYPPDFTMQVTVT